MREPEAVAAPHQGIDHLRDGAVAAPHQGIDHLRDGALVADVETVPPGAKLAGDFDVGVLGSHRTGQV